MKRNRFKFLTSIALVIMLCMGTVMPVFADTPISRVFAASDYQAKTGDAEGEQILGSIIDAMINDGHTTADGALYAGDYDYNMPSDTSHGIVSIKNVFNSKWPSLSEDNMVFVKGNHDPANTPGITPSGANDAENYGVFVINESDYMWFNNDKGTVQKTANNLQNYLDDKRVEGYSKPIFVISHLPLHYSMRTRNDGDGQYANLLFDVLNKAGSDGLNIIFLFGHDHSNGWDDYLGGSCIYLAKGDNINIAQSSRTEWKTETLNFTYMNPGYTGYYNQVNSGAENVLTSTMFTIYGNRVEINRYTTSGKYNLKSKGVRNSYKNESGYDVDTRVITSPDDVTLNTVKAIPAVKINNDGMDIIPVGGASTLTAEISNIVDPTFEWSSSNPDILSVEGNGDTALVYAVGKGSATINLNVIDGSDQTVTSASFDATAIDVANNNIYSLVNKVDDIVSGDKYFMVFTDTRNTLPKYSAVSHEVITNGGRTGLVPDDIGLTSDVAYLTGDYSSYEWTFTGSEGNYVISCNNGILSIDNNNVNLNGSANHIINITEGMNGLYLTDSETRYQLSDSSKGMFSGYAYGNGKQFSLYKKVDIVQTPSEPLNLSVIAGDREVTLSWDAPKINGGNAITGYQVSSDGVTWIDITNNSYTFTNLTNNTEYTFNVRAVNNKGAGMAANIIGTPVAENPNPSETVFKTALSIAVEMANKVTEEQLAQVVPAVVTEFRAALANGQTVLADVAASQETVDRAFTRLSIAMHMLEFVKGDKAELEALINSANELVEENYTADSWTVFKDALDAANVVNDNVNAMQAEIDQAVSALQAAIDSLEEAKAVDKTFLEGLVNHILGLDKDKYVEETWQAMVPVLQEAQAVLANEKATQAEVDASYLELIDSFLALRLKTVDKSALKALIEEAEKLATEDFTPNTWQALQEAIDAAKEVMNNENASQAEVDQARDNLQAALDGLQEVANKSELEALINEAQGNKEEDFTPDSWQALQEAIDAAKEVMDDKNASQAEVDQARDNLQAALDSLQEAVDKTLLEAMANKVTGLEEGKYIASTWQAMLPVLQEAQSVLANENASQAEVNAALNALTKAYLDLRLIPDKDLLAELINKTNGLNAANYSAKTWSVVADALNEATAVLNDPEATQKEVDTAKDTLTKAIKGLVENNSPVVKSGDTTASVKTGDDTLVGVFAGLGLLSMTTVLASYRRKEN